ncbi:Type I phosphodiesterase / nucleotide pyrophosphatase [Agreia pratensis]|uniref:Type I phosphodiesterase / nucleotide pyrophosphatase n=1 Tax=Agreia pratensis TaxID=150121 RepID=A0A1X7K8V8_9MICO|nr:Type I phosphodiesterase / nucleotide pyrophosphatase [Agreia pratensis]
MLPATRSDEPRLSDVLPSCLAAVTSEDNRLGLPAVSKTVVVLVDGLGASALRQRAGHARFLTSRFFKKATLVSGFPTTTAAALTSLTTGASPGQHGLVGYSALIPASQRVANQLTGWAPDMEPSLWQRRSTVFEHATAAGIDATAVGPRRYESSGFTHAVLRGAEYLAADSISDRFEAARSVLDRDSRSISYVYVPELDMTAHAHGWQSDRWTHLLEELDSAMQSFVRTVRADEGVLLTADHGVIDVPETSHVLFGGDEHMAGVIHIAGDPRCLQLHLDPTLSAEARQAVLDAWRESEGERAWVLTRHEAIEAGWFGAVDDAVVPRIGDIIVAAAKNIVYYDARKPHDPSRRMVGQHGSWNSDELMVPLLRFGAFER